MIVLGGVLILRRVAASHVSTSKAKPEMNPGVAHLETFLTAL
jgi:hypothetical protein